MPHTTGDLEFDPISNTWRPIGSPAIPPYQAGGVAATAAGPAPDPQIREQMRKELRQQGLPLPPHLEQSEAEDAAQLAELAGGQAARSRTSPELGAGPTVVSLGGTRNVVEGVIDVEAEAAEQAHKVDRLGELER